MNGPSQEQIDAFIRSPAGKRAYAEACAELNAKPRHLLDESNPNHPNFDNTIFGYPQQDFLAKQYR